MTTGPISTILDRAVRELAVNRNPNGWHVSGIAPSTYDGIVSGFARDGHVTVWNGASATSIFGDEDTNFAFRAWHDAIHIQYALGFDPAGERTVWLIQRSDLLAWCSATRQTDEVASYLVELLHADTIGQLEYAANHGGEFPADQRAFDLAYIADRQSAINGSF